MVWVGPGKYTPRVLGNLFSSVGNGAEMSSISWEQCLSCSIYILRTTVLGVEVVSGDFTASGPLPSDLSFEEPLQMTSRHFSIELLEGDAW